jgi:hypothetical protein
VTEPAVLAAVEAALVAHFAQLPQRASVCFVGVEPIEVLRFEPIPGERAYVSLGMSRRPMTGAGERVQAQDGPRAELFVHVRDPADEHADLWRQLAVLAATPAVEGVVYAPGMSVDVGQALSSRSSCTGVVVTDSPLEVVPTDAGPVAVLRAVPATPTELAWCRVRGATALLQRWSAADTDLLDLARQAVALD